MPTVPGTPTPPNRPEDPKAPRQQPHRPQQHGQPSPFPGHKAVVLVTGALMIYFGTLWLGVVVIGDTPIRSAVMAALILAIAATGYLFNRRPATPEE